MIAGDNRRIRANAIQMHRSATPVVYLRHTNHARQRSTRPIPDILKMPGPDISLPDTVPGCSIYRLTEEFDQFFMAFTSLVSVLSSTAAN